jgi:hypothetical protein
MKRVLVGRSCDDGIDFAVERQPCRRLDGVTGDPPRTDDTIAVEVRVATAEAPRSHRDFTARGDRGNLVFRPNKDYFGFEWLKQRAGSDLRADPAWIAQGNGESRT